MISEDSILQILNKSILSKKDIVRLLKTDGEEKSLIFSKAAEIKKEYVGNIVYFRGLVEFSNICGKNCFYCGIRLDNKNVKRYDISDSEILTSVKYAFDNKYGSVVLQSGEIDSPAFSSRMENLIHEIKKLSNNELGITLSCGEQSEETYRRWFECGAHRYLLRIESSNPEIYKKLHPANKLHDFQTRLNCLKLLKKTGYQVGTGVMIGLPFQTYEDLADDLLFMKEFDIDMCGMGPYIEHQDTPLYKYMDLLLPKKKRFDLALKMIAVLRIMMKDINIAAATAMQALDPVGREKAIKVGANIIMPNITPGKYRDYYKLYENKPCTTEDYDDCSSCLDARIAITGNEIGFGKWGDSKHFKPKS
jgi:biotin synthase